MLIEVESKFQTERNNLSRLLSEAERVKAEEITDEFADTKDFDLVRNKLRLRRRNGEWQLKIGVRNNLTADGIKSYQEVEGDDVVNEALLKLVGKNLNEMEVFAVIEKFREKYSLMGFGIDLDRANYRLSEYQVNEIELMVESEAEKALAEERIRQFASEQNLILGEVRGTLMEYLYRHQHSVYQKLKKLKKEGRAK
ncbi:MAG: CYTH domain-containing protein [Candidatus Altimarinota bacterium]